jgi:hypothetical protein
MPKEAANRSSSVEREGYAREYLNSIAANE